MAKAKSAAAEEVRGEMPPAQEEAPRWRVGTWAGEPNYSCLRCPFATLDIERIRSHRCELPTTGA